MTLAPDRQDGRPSPLDRLVDLAQYGLGFGWTFLCILAAFAVLVATRSRRLPLAMARRLWAPGLLRIAGGRLRVSGGDDLDWARPHVFVVNHTSFADIAAVFAALPVPIAFVLKNELRAMPFVGWYAAAMGMVFVDRRGRHGALDSVEQAQQVLAAGRNLVQFPEGTRGRDGELGTFKSGSFAAPLAAGVPVVPVAILGAGTLMPARTLVVRSTTVRVAIGEEIPVSGLGVDDRAAVAKRAREAVAVLLAGLLAETADERRGDAPRVAGAAELTAAAPAVLPSPPHGRA